MLPVNFSELDMRTSELPTLYQYYTNDHIISGLSNDRTQFTLNNKNITIYSGAMHYFRVPPEYWSDRLRKMRAVGLNAVETYVPWNLHEPQPHCYEFGQTGTEFMHFLDIEKFLKTAQEEDLFVIVRPGPYICAELDFGGLPSWLLRNSDIKVRTSDPNFIQPMRRYLKELLNVLTPRQFTKGGPIIAFQIENEYGNTKVDDGEIDLAYLETIKSTLMENGIVEMLFTSDTPSNGNHGSVPGVISTANFQEKPGDELDLLASYQPEKPLMVMEYWTGWFDHWTENHHTRTNKHFCDVLKSILEYPASVNMYMFHGGTNWGFINGANITDSTVDNSAILHDTTSYDYDAPLSECGDYTDKYFSVKELLAKHSILKTRLPDLPALKERISYDAIVVVIGEMNLSDLLLDLRCVKSRQVLPMEHEDVAQNFGYIIYRKENMDIIANSVLEIEGHVCDTVVVLINGKIKSKILQCSSDFNEFGFWRLKNSKLNLGKEPFHNATIDLMVENWGRANYGKLNQFNQYKGLWQGQVKVNAEVLCDWKIYPLEFCRAWIENLKMWRAPVFEFGPKLYRAILDIVEDPLDTYVDMRDWNKGIIIVNGFVLARYLKMGPQQAAYLPATFLKRGENDVLIFEHYEGRKEVKFSKNQIYETHNLTSLS